MAKKRGRKLTGAQINTEPEMSASNAQSMEKGVNPNSPNSSAAIEELMEEEIAEVGDDTTEQESAQKELESNDTGEVMGEPVQEAIQNPIPLVFKDIKKRKVNKKKKNIYIYIYPILPHSLRQTISMEILPSVKPQRSRIPLYNPNCFIDSNRKNIFNSQSDLIFRNSFRQIKDRRLVIQSSSYDEGVSITQQSLENMPISVDLERISSESQFDRVVGEAQQLEESVVILWMASWCRKCIYLKPKLEKLAADYYPRVRFYSVDVNSVPHKLVVRAGVTLWRDGKKQGEVIGGHKAYLVVNEIREMIDSENTM
ncbi:hypothetical protein BUALT_Bualt01G0101100 [Buddleja alternifolia]|uniref:Thioredoxin domain-containing protein n=1 Tax=Buddleja alternifolia TaxID=168488 RepID=A0AAV6YDR7_9LAMI|nr:hypothetical protein BUALT_Bualt01G0101100 [Buddleja alternifolia]